MDQNREDYGETEPPRREPSAIRMVVLIVSLTLLVAALACAGFLILLAREAGPR